jgi:FkbM family methyltransferase
MQLLRRIRRKIGDVLSYPRLAWRAGDRRELWILGLLRNRVPGSGLAARMAIGGRRIITPRLVQTRGQRVRVEMGESGQIDVFDELFIAGIYDLGSVGFAPSLVVDCGAYCGYFSAMAAGVFPGAQIVCFEANPSNLPMLEAQLALLDVKVELRAAAVHTRDGKVTFSGSGTGGAIGSPGGGDSREVACVDFPRWLAGCAPASLVLKMDVEGAELELLPAILNSLPRQTAFFLETHHPDRACEALLAPYRNGGFAVLEVRRRKAEGKGYSYIEWMLNRNS